MTAHPESRMSELEEPHGVSVPMPHHEVNYVLIFVASVALRAREPHLPRPFRIPGGTAGMVVAAGMPTLVGLFVMVANGVEYLLLGAAIAATGPVLYMLTKRG